MPGIPEIIVIAIPAVIVILIVAFLVGLAFSSRRPDDQQ